MALMLSKSAGTPDCVFQQSFVTRHGSRKASPRASFRCTLWSYLAGYAVVYIAAPIIYLVLGILPVFSVLFKAPVEVPGVRSGWAGSRECSPPLPGPSSPVPATHGGR
jgi:hypothetical protein